MKLNLQFITALIFSLLASCTDDIETIEKKNNLNMMYVILDQSSTTYSADGGEEENCIHTDTSYICQFIDDVFNSKKRIENKSEVILFFNYIDNEANGNEEVYLKIPILPQIDSIYEAKAGEVINSKKSFKTDVQKQIKDLLKIISEFQNNKKIALQKIEKLLQASKEADGSDCTGTLLVADKKLNEYYINPEKYDVGKKIIVAFSDLVNIPSNNTQVDLTNIVVRPGYTSAVPYIHKSQLKNKTTQEEFSDFLFTYLNF